MDRDLESIQEARRLVEKAAEAQKVLDHFSQEQTDHVVAAMAEAARHNADALARLAVEETTYGVVADKIEKTLFSARDVYAAIKDLKTTGVIREDAENGVVEIAVPVGVVAAIIPCTNPTSTAVFKALIALKARNAVVMSPHPSAVKCIRETVRVMAEAALSGGAPEGCVSCISTPTMEATEELMRHRSTAIILATGGAGLVRAAYSSGKPALGVGPGNVPAYVHCSAKIPKAVADILTGKTFDNGTICSSEQHIVADQAIAGEVRAEVERQGGYFLNRDQAAAVAGVLISSSFRVNSKMVGQSVDRIAREAGISIPPGTRALVAPLDGVGRQYPLSAEKLSPVLSFYVVKDWHEGLDLCTRLLHFGGTGHTMSMHATDDRVVREMALALPAFRLVVNSPATLGSIGYTTRLFPSMSLGCGTPGGNITSDNISPMHLVNLKRLAYERRPVNRETGEALPRPAREATVSAPIAATSGVVKPIFASGSLPLPAVTSTVTQGVLPAPDREAIGRIVERFLAAKQTANGTRPELSQGALAHNPAPTSVVSTTANLVSAGADPRPAPKAERAVEGKNTSPIPATAQPRPVDFVSEDDVRQAIKKGERIYVGPRTIITPSARDLADPREVFVVVK
ncbi:MAG TPA: aldehyde dehydrogenase family protein [Terriglobia bacterium]|nr:aldehyde dehydrogenase family protein [Terriglobia bacterium]